MNITQRETEYKDYELYVQAHGFQTNGIDTFDLLKWLHSNERKEWQDHKRLLAVPLAKTTTPFMPSPARSGASKPLANMSYVERKAVPLLTGVVDYFLPALVEVAKVSKVGNDQHNPGEPLHWAKGKSTDHGDTAMRHLAQHGQIDNDSCRHTAKAAWRILAMLTMEIEAEQAGMSYNDYIKSLEAK